MLMRFAHSSGLHSYHIAGLRGRFVDVDSDSVAVKLAQECHMAHRRNRLSTNYDWALVSIAHERGCQSVASLDAALLDEFGITHLFKHGERAN